MKKQIWISLTLFTLAGSLLLSACRDSFENCENNGSCPEIESSNGGGGSSSVGGGSGKGDDSSGGTTSGSGATGGTAGDGDGDTGGTGGTTSPCDACTGETPACNAAEECVECTDADTSACDGTNTPVCVEETCLECGDNADCTDPSASLCQAGTCTACTSNDDCTHLAGTGVCDAGTCVECTPANYAACGVDTADTGDPFVCDALTNTCSTTATEGGASLCQSCVSNAHCLPGQACVVQSFGGEGVGAFCFWIEGGGSGAPANCALNARPYVDQLNGEDTLDGTTADICGLRATTCPALQDYSSLDCAPGGVPDDDLCGAEGLTDGYCGLFANPNIYRCTVPCGSADDCETGFACEAGTPKLCAL